MCSQLLRNTIKKIERNEGIYYCLRYVYCLLYPVKGKFVYLSLSVITYHGHRYIPVNA